MATQPSDKLFNLVRGQNKARTQAWGRFGASLVPTFAATRAGGPEAGRAMAKSFYPEHPGLTPQQKLAAKTDLVKLLQDGIKAQQSTDLSLLDKIKAKDGVLKELIQTVGTLTGVDAKAIADTVQNQNTVNAGLAKDMIGFHSKMIESTNPQAAAGMNRAFENFNTALGPSGIKDPNFAAWLNDTAIQMRAQNDEAGFQAMLAGLAAKAAAEGVDIESLLSESAQVQGPASPAAQALQQINQIGGQYQELAANSFSAAQMEALAARRGMKGVGDSGDRFLKLLGDTMEKMGVAQDPGDADLLFEDLAKQLPGYQDSKTPAENIEAMLGQIDDENLPPASHLLEARRRLFAEPEFQAWKKENGFETDGAALKEMRRLLSTKLEGDRVADRANARARRRGGVGPETGPASRGAAGLTNTAPGSAPQPAEGVEPTFIRTDNGVMWYGSDGLREPTPEELFQLREDIRKGGAEAASTLIAPKTSLQKYQQAAAKLAERTTFEAEDKATTPAVTPGRTMAGQVTHSLTHPESAVKGATSLIAQALKKKKLPEDFKLGYGLPEAE